MSAVLPTLREPPFRQLVRMVKEPYDFYLDCYKKFGPVSAVHIFGQPRWVLVGDPEAVRTIFKASADEFHGDSEGIKYLVGPKTVLFLNGEQHRRERRVLNAPFKHERMAVYAERMIASANDVIDGLRPGQELVGMELMQKITLRVIIECIFGVSDPKQRERLQRLLSEHMHAMQNGALMASGLAIGGDRLRAILEAGTRFFATPFRDDDPPPARNPLRRFFETRSEIRDILRRELRKAKSGERGERDDVLALLASAHYDDGIEMSDDSRMDELFALLIGGHETTAITLAWTLHYLARDPEMAKKLRTELDEIFGDGPIDAVGIERAKYLQAVIDETLRIRPVAAAVPRRTMEDVELCGYRIPAGTYTLPCPAILHFREDLWPEPETFRPERFLDKRPSPFHFLPFGGGSRACLGRPFATMEMRLVLAEMVRRVDLSPGKGAATVPAQLGILAGPSDGVPVRIDAVRPRAAGRPRGTRTTSGDPIEA